MARVQVNRLWQRHFGVGLVATAENLGVSGALPSHPELLEWLAARFVESGWSLKAMHRMILESQTFRQSSLVTDAHVRLDPENHLLGRFPVRRLDAEAIRDSMLAVAGDLDTAFYGPAVATRRDDAGEVLPAEEKTLIERRSLYLKQRRTQVLSVLAVFDSPTIVFNSIQRPTSTIPLQALSLLNSRFGVTRARRFAERLLREHPDDRARVAAAIVETWGLPADEAEISNSLEFVATQAASYANETDAPARAWADFCQVIFAANAFLYVE
jgi:hypothetical protein